MSLISLGLVVFLCNLAPILAPPTWTVIVFFLITRDLNPVATVIIAALAAVVPYSAGFSNVVVFNQPAAAGAFGNCHRFPCFRLAVGGLCRPQAAHAHQRGIVAPVAQPMSLGCGKLAA